ncbi:UNVERIFIED_CONTAM: hypothetical protein NCL1_25934 [Trichonephila clavipes]
MSVHMLSSLVKIRKYLMLLKLPSKTFLTRNRRNFATVGFISNQKDCKRSWIAIGIITIMGNVPFASIWSLSVIKTSRTFAFTQ